MIEEIVIAAGGSGTRIHKDYNPLSNKCLMSYNGKYIIQYVIELAKNAGISTFFISVNDEQRDLVEEICKGKHIKYRLAPPAKSFSYVPLLFEDHIQDKFFIVCGHQPIPTIHFQTMFKSSQNNDLVATTYSTTLQRLNRQRVIITRQEQCPFQLKESEEVTLSEIYLSSPYILNRKAIEALRKNENIFSLSELMYYQSLNGYKIGCVSAIMPHEFDTIDEFVDTRRSIDNHCSR
jgi:dTDP-glucose pyrophosphorylase